MKYIIFLLDGMADEVMPELNNQTPIMSASTKNIDRLAQQSIMGTFLSLPDQFPTSSDVANLSVLGYDLNKSYTGRGPIEAVSAGISLDKIDIAFRMNIISIKDGILTDYSAGQILQKNSEKIINALQKELGNEKICFHSGVSYRNLLILKGKEFSEDIQYEKPDASQGQRIIDIFPKARSLQGRYTEEKLLFLMNKSIKIINNLEIAEPDTMMIWPWSPGKMPKMQTFLKKYNKRGAIISAVDVIKGIGKLAKMTVIPVKGATGYLDSNFEGKADAAFNALQDHDFVFCHIECIDEVSHEGNLQKKLQAIEIADKRLIGHFLDKITKKNMLKDLTIGILPDHPVPVKLRSHTRAPVPFMIFNSKFEKKSATYNEITSKNGTAGYLKDDQFMKLLFKQ